jgi:membrane-bound lytic murein transglycosylase D
MRSKYTINLSNLALRLSAISIAVQICSCVPKQEVRTTIPYNLPDIAIQEAKREAAISEKLEKKIKSGESCLLRNDILAARFYLSQAYDDLKRENNPSFYRELNYVSKELKASKRQKIILPSPNPSTKYFPLNAGMDIPRNKQVEEEMNRWLNKNRKTLLRWLRYRQRYLAIIEPALKENSLPLVLSYLPAIESSYKPKALSRAGAYGLWQFMPGTGKSHGLERNYWIDERADIEKSTLAACKYLKSLYKIFGSWALALSAYNAGPGYLSKELKKQSTRDFWSMDLYKETSMYVPRFFAVVVLGEGASAFDIQVPEEEALSYEIYKLNKPLSLKEAAKGCDTSLEVVWELNSELNHACTPAKGYDLKIPKGSSSKLKAYLSSLNEDAWWPGKRIKLQSKSLSSIARQYKVPLDIMMELNEGAKKGDTILIPVGEAFKSIKKNAPSKHKKRRKRH